MEYILQAQCSQGMVGNEVPGVTIKAGKTGYTDEAHNCLVNFAEKDGKEYVTVMAAAGNRWYVIFDGLRYMKDIFHKLV